MSPTAPPCLWCTQLAHQTEIHSQHDHGRMVVMENIYKRRVLAWQLFLLNDAEIEVLGPVQLNSVDSLNQPTVKHAINALKQASRGAWELYQANKSPFVAIPYPKLRSKRDIMCWRTKLKLYVTQKGLMTHHEIPSKRWTNMLLDVFTASAQRHAGLTVKVCGLARCFCSLW